MSPAARRFRVWNSLTHTWLGLIFGIVFAVLGATGALISLQPEIESALFPPVRSQVVCLGEPSLLNLETELAAATSQPVDRLYFPNSTDPRVHLRFKDGENQYQHLVYDSCSGKLLGAANLSWLDWTIDLHHNFLAAKTGRKVVGVAGAILLLNALAGLILWLLTKPQIRHLWSLPPRPGAKAWNYYTHRAVGLAAMAFLLLEAGTGIFLAFPIQFETAAARPKMKRDKSQLLPLDKYLNEARKLRPASRIREVRWSAAGGPVSIKFWARDAQLSLNRADATLLSSGRQPFQSTIAWLHYGEWGAAASRYLAALLGLTPAFLFVSGFLIWWLPKLAARRRKSPVPEKPSQDFEPRSYPAI